MPGRPTPPKVHPVTAPSPRPTLARSLALALALVFPFAPALPLTAATLTAIPRPLPDHPGNIHLAGEPVVIPLPRPANTPTALVPTPLPWRLRNERGVPLRSGTVTLDVTPTNSAPTLDLGPLAVGWYRLESGPDTTNATFTTLAVLRPLAALPPDDTPIAVDAAIAWFANTNAARQRAFANLAALAGVRMVRDRLRWRDLQPTLDGLVPPGTTTYDTAADAQHAEHLSILQVFHDTPPWARAKPSEGAHFSHDLRTVHAFARQAALRFRGRVTAWEPWNEANVESFGAHTVDQMCAWQKAAFLGFKSTDPTLVVGWNPTAAVPTPEHTEGVLANETWPYFDTYNIHSYDWAHGYRTLWEPARRAAAGRPLWITEADRGTKHLGNAPWFDQDPRLESLKAEWIPQAYAESLFAGATRHFHFVLGAYHEPNGVQFGLLRHDLTPRPAYAALAATGRCLAGARSLGRWRPDPNGPAQVHAFRAGPDGIERDVLVAWAEQEVDWDARGRTTAEVRLPSDLTPIEVVDHLGRTLAGGFPHPLTSAPVFVLLPVGQAATLPLEAPPVVEPRRSGEPSPVVLQLAMPRTAIRKVEDRPWSEGHAYTVAPGDTVPLALHVYNFGTEPVAGTLRIDRHPPDWSVSVNSAPSNVPPGDRLSTEARLRIPWDTRTPDGWVVLRYDAPIPGRTVLAFRVRATP